MQIESPMNIGFRTVASLGVVVASFSIEATLAQTTERVSVDSNGAQGNSGSVLLSISPDGRFVAFDSYATNLVAGDLNATQDVFVHDRLSGTTELVSVSTSGAQADNGSTSPSISTDGRVVAFWSYATNLVPGDTNAAFDIFVRDRWSLTTERVSVATNGTEADASSFSLTISPDGCFVAFDSLATNLVAGDTNGIRDVFVHDRRFGTTERVSVDTNATQANGASGRYGISISATGRFVAFDSEATNLVAGDTNGFHDVFVRDRQSATTERVSLAVAGAEANHGCGYYGVSISNDGRWVAFDSYATNLVAGDSNGSGDTFVHDRATATTERVSVSTSGAQGNSHSFDPAISADGRFVTFRSEARNLVTGDSNAYHDVFVRDREQGTTERVSVAPNGAQANYGGEFSSISADGRFVAFESIATNLVAGDTNAYSDVFVRDRGPLPPRVYCTSSTSSNGCIASIAANANPSVSSANVCSLSVANVEGQKSGILFYGVDDTGFSLGAWASGSTSWLCVKQPTQRTPVQDSGGTFGACNGSFALDWNAFQTANPLALGNPWNIGNKVYAQAWFRDPSAVKSTNLSDALELTYLP